MAAFFLFGKYSADAAKDISLSRTDETLKLIKKFGGELISIHALLGEIDLVCIVTFPGIEQAIKFSVAITRLTGIQFTTSEAVSVEDFDRLISEI
jgi:uncharacterized protein with GYD domain